LFVTLNKVFIIDTNVLLDFPHSIFSFKDESLIIPLAVIEELDRFKHEQTDRGRNSRVVSRTINELRSQGSLLEGVKTKDGGIIKVKSSLKSLIDNLPDELNRDAADNAILAVAIEVEGILVTNDSNLQIKADSLGLPAESYESGRVSATDAYEGHCSTMISGEEMTLLSHGPVDVDGEYYENECLSLHCQSNLNQTRLAIHKGGKAHAIANYDQGVSKIRPRNREQQFALELLMDDSVPLVTIAGTSGTGKTLLALAAGLQLVTEQRYTRMLVSRPVIPLGKQDIGFLPGSEQEKMAPWMQPIRDNLDVIMASGKSSRKDCDRNWLKELETQGLLKIEPLGFIRGRSIPNQFFIIDEAQNLSMAETKAIMTRAGEGTKLVLIGDVEQVDSPFLDSTNNGLAKVIECFKESSLSGHITLINGIRSPLSELAAKLL
jgi:PhoH-like ATPase